MNESEGGQAAALALPLGIAFRHFLSMRILIAVLIALLFFLNVLLWKFDNRGIRQVRALELAITAQKAENAALAERNSALEAEVKSLKEGLAAIEERARAEMGMIRKGETFYYILEDLPPKKPNPDSPPPKHD